MCLGENVTDYEINEMLRETKLNPNGAVTFSEFVKILSSAGNDVLKISEVIIREKINK
jgi:Ca2+-binding EF-hand superfamily protein